MIYLAWLRAAKDPLVFNPHLALKQQIRAAGNAIAGHFREIDSALDHGADIQDAVQGKRIRAVMQRVISSARTQGFTHAVQYSKKKAPALYGRDVYSEAVSRARRVDSMMRRTTRNVLTDSPDSQHVLSPERAIAAARYEATKAYFQGVADGFRGTGFKKNWFTTSAEPCEDCVDNEDQGPIGVDEVFQSGDDYPSAHLNCQCWVGVSK